MHQKGMNTIKDMGILLLNFLLIYTISLLFLEGMLGIPYVRITLFLLLMFSILLYWIRKKVRKLWKFMLCHIVSAAALVLLAGTSAQAAYYMIFGIVYAVVSFYKRIEHKEESLASPAFGIIVILICYVFGYHKGYLGVCRYMIGIILVYLMLYFLLHYLQQYIAFVRANAPSASYIPMKRMLQSGGIFVVLFSGISMLLLFLLAGTPLIPTVAVWLGAVGKSLLRIIFNTLQYFIGSAPEMLEDLIDEQEIVDLYEGEEWVAPIWLQYIYQFISFLFTLIAVGVILFCFYRFIVMIIHAFAGKEDEQEEKEFILPRTKKARVKETEVWKGERLPFFSRSPDERIRKIFYKVALSRKKDEDIAYYTPYMHLQNCETEAERDAMSRLIQLYEKARYSRETCTNEDVKLAKSIQNSL